MKIRPSLCTFGSRWSFAWSSAFGLCWSLGYCVFKAQDATQKNHRSRSCKTAFLHSRNNVSTSAESIWCWGCQFSEQLWTLYWNLFLDGRCDSYWRGSSWRWHSDRKHRLLAKRRTPPAWLFSNRRTSLRPPKKLAFFLWERCVIWAQILCSEMRNISRLHEAQLQRRFDS